jgi:nucleoside-diphosphate-sugar epimerase
MRVLVTGGMGFVGQHVAAALKADGHSVKVVDDLSASRLEDAWADIDAFSQVALADLAPAYCDVDAVVHLAARTSVPESCAHPGGYFETNVRGTAALLAAMCEAGCGRIIYSSTAAVYGFASADGPIPEDAPAAPASPYAATKLAAEDLILGWARTYGWDACSLRYFNPYGPRENHRPETHLVPALIRAAATGEPAPLYNRGEQRRDLVYVGDLAAAHAHLLALDGIHVLNVGSGSARSPREVADMLGAPVRFEHGRGGEPPFLLANIDRIAALGWAPATTIEEGLAMTAEWFNEKEAT